MDTLVKEILMKPNGVSELCECKSRFDEREAALKNTIDLLKSSSKAPEAN